MMIMKPLNNWNLHECYNQGQKQGSIGKQIFEPLHRTVVGQLQSSNLCLLERIFQIDFES